VSTDEGPVPLPLETTKLEVAQPGYPSEVMCRQCRNLMLPADLEGRTWECFVCGRRIEVILRPPAAS
jgi:hypothetical protein